MFKPEPGVRYDMPVVFGPSELRGEAHSREVRMISHSFRTDPEAIEPLVPYHFRLASPARVTVSGRMHIGVDWLAGRDYSSVRVSIDAVATEGGDSVVTAPYGLVVWEGNPYPAFAGREYLGISKIVAEIPEHEYGKDAAAFECSEYGTRLLRVAVNDLVPVDDGVIAAKNSGGPGAALAWKFIPGFEGTSDVDYPIKMVHRGKVISMSTGTGSLTFDRPSWEQCPHSHRIMATLAALPVLEQYPAIVTVSTGLLDRAGSSRLD